MENKCYATDIYKKKYFVNKANQLFVHNHFGNETPQEGRKYKKNNLMLMIFKTICSKSLFP